MGKNILITPGDALINFSGLTTANLNLEVQDDGRVSFVSVSSGAEQLTITDSLSGSVFTINNSVGMYYYMRIKKIVRNVYNSNKIKEISLDVNKNLDNRMY